MVHRIAITPGEPAGIGPDILITLAQFGHAHELIAVADPQLLRQRAKSLGLPLALRDFSPAAAPRPLSESELVVAPIHLNEAAQAGKLNPANAFYVIDTLNHAVQLCRQNQCQALVTGPINKSIINDAKSIDVHFLNGQLFLGHTEFLAQACGCDTVVMMLATTGLRVALATTHLPLRQVAESITAESLQNILKILHQSLQANFAIPNPHIVVCGLNPHAGEGGHLGREEIDIIIPVLEKLRRQGLRLTGPLPADTAFTPKIIADCDAMLAMYHDQGLPVLKYKGFGKAVNITLGLPIIRTSVDHGTALDLAGTGKANTGSLQVAIDYAVTMADARCKNTAATGT